MVVDSLIWVQARHTRIGGTVAVEVLLGLGLVAAASILVRRRHPLVAFATTWVFGLFPLAVPSHEPFAGLLICLYTVANRCRPKVSVIVLACAAVPLGINAFNTVYLSGSRSAGGLLTVTGVWLMIGVVVWGFGRFAYLSREEAERREREHRLEEALAVNEERLRLARDLHDIVSHSVGVMTLQASVAQRVVDTTDRPAVDALRVIAETGSGAMRELHQLLGVLRSDATVGDGTSDSDGGDAPGGPTLDDVDHLVETARACGVDVTTQMVGQARALAPPVVQAAYRTVQEGLANVIKHGGPEAHADLVLRWTPEELTITLRNDRRAPISDGLSSGGFGLTGLNERVERLGGRLQQGPDGGQGFALNVTLPAPDATTVGP